MGVKIKSQPTKMDDGMTNGERGETGQTTGDARAARNSLFLCLSNSYAP
jgi:hypothetical protein